MIDLFTEETDAQVRLILEILNLTSLQTELNEGTTKLTAKALRNYVQLLFWMDNFILSKCIFFPGNDGGVYLRGRLSCGILTIFFNGKSVTYIMKGKDVAIGGSLKFNKEAVQSLNSVLKEYI